MKKPKWPVVEVLWFDSATSQGWGPLDDHNRESDHLRYVRTVGYLILEDDKVIRLAHGYAQDADSLHDVTTIPLTQVQERRYLRGR